MSYGNHDGDREREWGVLSDIVARGFPVMGQRTSYEDRKHLGRLGGDWNKVKKRWCAPNVEVFDALVSSYKWLPEGVSCKREACSLSERFRAEEAALEKKVAEEAAASRKRKQPTEDEILRARRKELGIPPDDPKLVAALFEEHGITQEEIDYSERVAHFGPTIMNAERLWRALRLNLTTVAAIKGKDWNYNPSNPPSKIVKRH